MSNSEVWFGRFRLDLKNRELLHAGAHVKLSSRALEILCLLASAKGELVTKDEILAQVWPGVIVGEGNIQVHVSALRKGARPGTARSILCGHRARPGLPFHRP